MAQGQGPPEDTQPGRPASLSLCVPISKEGWGCLFCAAHLAEVPATYEQ